MDIEVRLFNSLSKYGRGRTTYRVSLPAQSTVRQAVASVGVPAGEIFLLLLNGRNIMCGFGSASGIEDHHELEHGDTLALSGAIPFSRGYGSPVI